MFDAYKITSKNGIVMEQDYPVKYQRSKGQCRDVKGKEKYFNTNQHEEDDVSNDRLKELLAKQPVGIAIHSNGSCLSGYSRGIIKAEECECNDGSKYEVNHGVTLVGYGKSERPDCSEYWLIKNSWGPEWGEGGFFRLCADKNSGRNPKGTCQVNAYVQYPTLE